MRKESSTETTSSTQKERPLIFSAPMIRAILDGSKTQTRRIVKHEIRGPNPPNPPGLFDHYIRGKWVGAHKAGDPKSGALSLCPYGVAGDRLWVRETFAQYAFRNRAPRIVYRADNELHGFKGWKPSIFMPRKLARIWLEITGVRVERLQEISEPDAFAEGCIQHDGEFGKLATERYSELWDSLHGKGAWKLNPWVFVIEFRRMTQ